MRKFNVTFEIFNGMGAKKTEMVTVEAGSKKIATIRAMTIISKRPEYKNQYMTVISVEEEKRC